MSIVRLQFVAKKSLLVFSIMGWFDLSAFPSAFTKIEMVTLHIYIFMACNTWFLDCHQAMLPQSSCNSCNLYLHLFIDTCNPNLNIDLLLTVIVTGWISWSLIWTNHLFWKIEEKEYLKRTSLWYLLICHIVSCQTECRLITFYYMRLNVPAYM